LQHCRSKDVCAERSIRCASFALFSMFNSIDSLQHTIFAGTLGYAGILLLLRLSGKRTLSKWNSFDFVVTIAFGSILASLLLSTDTSLAQGLLAFAMLVFFQFVLTWIAARSSMVQHLIKAEPSLLFFQGEFQHQVMEKERVAQGEILAAMRESGISETEKVAAVVLETDGSFSVIKTLGNGSALRDVRGVRPAIASQSPEIQQA